MAKVKDYWDQWETIVYDDKMVKRSDLRGMRGWQIGRLSSLHVVWVETDLNGKLTIFASQKS